MPCWVSAGRSLNLAPGIGEEFQRPRCGDRHIFLAQRACGRVARIGEHGVFGLRLLLVQLEKILLEHVDFAAHFAGRRNVAALQLVRNVLDGADIGGDVLARETVAARRSADQFAVLVAQRQRQAIDLRLGHQRRNMPGVELEKAPDAVDELGNVLVAEGVAERQHGNGMLHFRKAARGRGADRLRRRIRRHQIGKFCLDRFQPLAQRVVGGVRNRRRILLVVPLVMRFELQRQPHVLDLGLRLGELGYIGEGFWFCYPGHAV